MTSITIRPSSRSVPHDRDRRVVHGFKRPDDRIELTSNERTWIGFLRAIAGDTDPQPTLVGVQALRRALMAE